MHGLPQRTLFGHDVLPTAAPPSAVAGFPRATTSLQDLVAAEFKFRTIYADPPRDYEPFAREAREHDTSISVRAAYQARTGSYNMKPHYLHLCVQQNLVVVITERPTWDCAFSPSPQSGSRTTVDYPPLIAPSAPRWRPLDIKSFA